MKVKTLIRFTDLKEKTIREVGEVFDVTKRRLEDLLLVSSNPLVEIVVEKETTKKAVNEPKSKKK